MKEMIVEAFLSSFFGLVFERLASSNLTDYFSRVKLDTLVDKLESILISINQVLDDAEKKQYENPDVKTWLGDVKHAMYEADQLLDEIATDAPLKKMKVESPPSTSTVFNFIPTFTNPFKSRLKELIESLDSLAEQKDKLQLKKRVRAYNADGVDSKLSERLPTTYLVDASQIYGRDDEKDEMVKFLLSNNGNGNGNQTPVSSIVGLGGMGKTTFAKLVYNDSRIEECFELKAWVYVSESFDVVGLTKAILKSFHSPADDESIFNLLQERLQHILTGKKYLLVLDDIWNGNADCWEQLLLPFNHGSYGSKIIVTTRDKEVAYVLNSTKIFDLQQLDKRDCWSLFVTHAFRRKNVCEYPNLELIGEKILNKCGGLPLAVKTMGQLLRKKFSQAEWSKILDTNMWCLLDEDNNINPVLRLSYHNLPSNHKRCFAYCSIFSKGYLFEKDGLIKLWMAEGLLKCCGQEKSEDELGNEIFGDLESISFFQESFFNNYVMHDLVNDLAKSISGEFCIQIEGAKVEGISERTRHIRWSLQSNFVDKLLDPICEVKGLRSLLVEGKKHMMITKKVQLLSLLEGKRYMLIGDNVQRDMFSRLKYLQMLSFNGCVLLKLVDEISNLKLLRYLDLSHTDISSLPNTICMLCNLQTLLLEGCYNLTELPSDFSKLTNLRHLELPFSFEDKKMPKHIGNLSNLQALPYFTLEEHDKSDLKELAKLNNLHGKVHIKGLSNVIDLADGATTILKDKKYLEEIHMTFNSRREEMGGSIVENNVSVLEALEPNRNLKRLIIENYNGITFPNWLGGSHLPNLISLELLNCGLCSHFPPFGQFPSLKELSISRCNGIKIVGEEFYGSNSINVPFKSLEVLKFDRMDNWEEWLCLKGFPVLKELLIRNCPKLKKLVLGENHLINIPFLEALELDFSGFVECPSLDLCCYNSLCGLVITGWRFSSSPFSLHLFTNLNSLELTDCPKLESFSVGGFPSNLCHLAIVNCPKLIASREEWGLFQLNSLHTFFVGDDFENVECFPEEGLLPPTLDYLQLRNCSKLRIMNYKGFLHLGSLSHMDIENCPSLESLPEKSLPNSLSVLLIKNCPLLEEKYKKEGGERWHTISHIAFVRID